MSEAGLETSEARLSLYCCQLDWLVRFTAKIAKELQTSMSFSRYWQTVVCLDR